MDFNKIYEDSLGAPLQSVEDGLPVRESRVEKVYKSVLRKANLREKKEHLYEMSFANKDQFSQHLTYELEGQDLNEDMVKNIVNELMYKFHNTGNNGTPFAIQTDGGRTEKGDPNWSILVTTENYASIIRKAAENRLNKAKNELAKLNQQLTELNQKKSTKNLKKIVTSVLKPGEIDSKIKNIETEIKRKNGFLRDENYNMTHVVVSLTYVKTWIEAVLSKGNLKKILANSQGINYESIIETTFITLYNDLPRLLPHWTDR